MTKEEILKELKCTNCKHGSFPDEYLKSENEPLGWCMKICYPIYNLSFNECRDFVETENE